MVACVDAQRETYGVESICISADRPSDVLAS
jgi:hypothetical protein